MNDETLHAYFDGELSPEEAARLESELAADPSLAERLRELRGLDAALGALEGHEAGPAFADSVLARTRSPRRGMLLRRLAPLAAAAAIVVAVVLGREPQGTENDIRADELDYAWEADAETFGSLRLRDLEDEILKELETS